MSTVEDPLKFNWEEEDQSRYADPDFEERGLSQQTNKIIEGERVESFDTTNPYEEKDLNMDDLFYNNEEVISSRDLLKDYLKNQDQIKWGVIGSPRSDLNELGVNGHILGESISKLNECEGIIYLGCEYWDQNKQIKLEHKLQNISMQILVGNPDIVAPQKSSFSIEPGFWSLNFHKSKNFDIKYFGKPHLDIFEKAIQKIFKISQRKFNLDRIAMIGDSLHTDVLGGLASGISTVLVTNHGLFKNHDYQKEILRTQIYPDWIIPSI